ncbi:MAG: hypothetical protein FWD55_02960 [Propionibacteriaceae bacterium]|nr:hypothetical protein [Propionibacteriaceae bacterium]
MSSADEANGAPEAPSITYTAIADSELITGEVRLRISDNSLSVTGLFEATEISFIEIQALKLVDYTVVIETDSGPFRFSRMGEWCQRFYDEICAYYNTLVSKSLFISTSPILTTNGTYHYSEWGTQIDGAAPIAVYDNCVATLPPDLNARRVPLVFATGLTKGEFELTLSLETGESYTWSRLGYDTDLFADSIEAQIRTLREKSLMAIHEIDPTLNASQASQLSGLIPHGVAAPLSAIAGIAPSLVSALEDKIAQTCAAETYTAFKELSGSQHICVGFRKNDLKFGSQPGPSSMMAGLTQILPGAAGEVFDAASEADEEKVDPYLMWMIVPSPNGQYAAVEFAFPNSATFIYRTNGNFELFARALNRALEAIDFKREVIRLTDAELLKPENARYAMANRRTAALQFVRANFVTRVIHSSLETWKQKLTQAWI